MARFGSIHERMFVFEAYGEQTVGPGVKSRRSREAENGRSGAT